MQQQDIRCGACSRKLGAGKYTILQIKCPRCGTINHLRAARPEPAPPEGHSTETHEWPTTHPNKPPSAARR
ncbi:MAG: Com family DNA-binding transcriptional regulator [Desulfovibrionaceae bacterium]|nr:Com family DNA-binding transcriptional regulator [Desulfovibrionaceae bacterium]